MIALGTLDVYHPSTENLRKIFSPVLIFTKTLIKHYFQLETRFIFIPFISVPVNGKNKAWSEEEHRCRLFQVNLWY